MRYIATWRGTVRFFVRVFERRPSVVTPHSFATACWMAKVLSAGPPPPLPFHRLELVAERVARDVDRDLAVLERRVGEQLDDRALELAHARPHVLGDEANDVLGDRELEVVEVRLLPQDRDAVLEVRQLDVGDHAPLEARDEPCLEAGDLRRRPVAGEDDLAAAFVERVEGVEELLLHRLLALEEVHVVDEEEVGFAEAAAEVGGGSVLNRGDELVGELLGADEGDAGVGLSRDDLVRDGLHEVRLAESGVAVDEERVVDLAGRLGDGVGGGGGELVRLSDDEVVERVPIA